jgi:hypothetical protein
MRANKKDSSPLFASFVEEADVATGNMGKMGWACEDRWVGMRKDSSKEMIPKMMSSFCSVTKM